MGLDNRPANGKSDSGAGGLCGKERLENTVLVLIRYSHAGVFHGDHNIEGLWTDIGLYSQHTGPIGDGAHRFDRVHNQIHKYLMQLASIGQQLWEVISQISCDRHSLIPQIEINHGEYLSDEVVRAK